MYIISSNLRILSLPHKQIYGTHILTLCINMYFRWQWRTRNMEWIMLIVCCEFRGFLQGGTAKGSSWEKKQVSSIIRCLHYFYNLERVRDIC